MYKLPPAIDDEIDSVLNMSKLDEGAVFANSYVHARRRLKTAFVSAAMAPKGNPILPFSFDPVPV